jgi:hypothetical protein
MESGYCCRKWIKNANSFAESINEVCALARLSSLQVTRHISVLATRWFATNRLTIDGAGAVYLQQTQVARCA